MSTPSYHDLFVTTTKIERTAIFNLPYNLSVTCCRVSGWQVWQHGRNNQSTMIAGEYAKDGGGLRLDVAGHVIVDSLTPAQP